MTLRKILALALIASFVFASTVYGQSAPWSTAAFQSWRQGVTASGRMGVPRLATAALPTCNASTLGAVFLDTTTSTFKICDGTGYDEMGTAGGATAISMNDDVAIVFGTGSDSDIEWDTAQTPDAWVFGVGTDSRVLIIREKGDTADYAIAQQTNPSVIVHSAADTAAQYILMTHDGTNGIISSATGSVTLNDMVNVVGSSDIGLIFGTGVPGGGFPSINYMIGNTPDTLSLSLGSLSNVLTVVTSANQQGAYNHAQLTNPAIAVYSAVSAASSTTQYTDYTHLGQAPNKATVTVDGATTFAITNGYIVLACTGAETINTITGGISGALLIIENSDTDCTIADDDSPTAANAVDLTGAGANDVGAVAKVVVLLYNGASWLQVSESDN